MSKYFSKSALTSYKFCPRQYKLNYIDGIRTKNTPILATGSNVHNFMEIFFNYALEVEPSEWYKTFVHDDYSEYEKRMISNCLDFEQSRLEKYGKSNFLPVLRETMVTNDELGIRGIIDRVDKLNDEYIIVEYKTSKSIYVPGLQFELGFYKYLLNNTPPYNEWNIKLGCVINPRVGEVQYIQPSRQSTIINQINKLKDAISTDNFTPTCFETKYATCAYQHEGYCSIEDAQLYKGV